MARGGLAVSKVMALGLLLLFARAQLAFADDAGWLAAHSQDGSCALDPNTPGSHGGGCGGFLGWDCWGRPALHFVAHDIPWKRIGVDTLGAVVGVAEGLAAAVVATAAVAFLVATFPAWATAITVGAIALGVAALGYTVYSTVANWNRTSESSKFMLGGNLVGGLLGGVGPIGAFARSIGDFFANGVGRVLPWLGEVTRNQVASQGPAVPVGHATSRDVVPVNREFARLPPDVQQQILDGGVTIKVARGSVTDYLTERKGQSTGIAGIPWDEVKSVYLPDTGEAIISTQPDRTFLGRLLGRRTVQPVLTLHETGHGFDAVEGQPSHELPFLLANYRDLPNIDHPHLLQPGAAGIEETYAQSFGEYFYYGGLERWPGLDQYWRLRYPRPTDP